MTFAVSNRASIGIIPEVTFGTTPATPAFDALRFTGESLNYDIENIVSQEIRSDRMSADLIQVSSGASGSISTELSYDTFDQMLLAAMATTAWSTAVSVSATDIGVTSGTPDTITSTITDFTTENIAVGQWIKVGGFTETANNGFFRVTSVAANAIEVAQSTMVTEAAGDTITMAGQYIRNGSDRIGLSIQKVFNDLPSYQTFNGCMVNTFGLNFQTGQILNAEFGLMALGATVSATPIAGQSVTAAPTNTPLNAVSNVATIFDSDAVMTAQFKSLTLNLNNNIRAQDAIGSLAHIGLVLGSVDLTGAIELYFEDNTMYTRYLNATAFALSFTLTDANGNSYQVTLPNVKFESSSITAGGLNQDVMVSGQWRAILDSTTSTMMQIDKFDA